MLIADLAESPPTQMDIVITKKEQASQISELRRF